MSPHNYQMKFNGSVASKQDHQNKVDLFDKMYGTLYTTSGLRYFMSRRIFKRGIQDDQLSLHGKD